MARTLEYRKAFVVRLSNLRFGSVGSSRSKGRAHSRLHTTARAAEMEDRMAQLQRDPEMTTAIAAGFQAVLSQTVPTPSCFCQCCLGKQPLLTAESTRPINIMRGTRIKVFFNVKSGGTYSNQSALKLLTLNCNAVPHI